MAVKPQERRPAAAPVAPAPQPAVRPSAPGAAPPPASAAASKPAAEKKTDGTNANLWLCGAIGLGITIPFCLILWMLDKSMAPDPNSYLGRFIGIFLYRGWVDYVEAYFFYWALTILFFKYRMLSRQKQCISFDILPRQIADSITPENVDGFRNHVSSLPCRPGESFLVDRISRALDHFRSRSSLEEVKTLITSQSDQDVQTAQTSYTMLNFFTWSIPILGFIGTVQGIGQAVGTFSATLEAASDITRLKEALKGVTSGLGVAFDTTLLALCLALIIVMVMRILEKGEGDLLVSVDDYCSENLIGRLDDGGVQVNKQVDRSSEWVRDAVKEAMAAQAAEFQTWTAKLEAAGSIVTQRVTEGWETIHSKLLDAQNAELAEIRGVVNSITEDRKEFTTQVKDISDQQVQQLTGAVGRMAETASTIQGNLTSLQQKQVENFKDVIATLKGDLQNLQQETHQRTKGDAEKLQAMSASFSETLAKMQQQAAASQTQLSQHLEQASAAVTQKVVEAWQSIDDKLKQSHSSQLEDVQKVLGSITEERQQFIEQVKATQSAQVSQFAGVVKAMEETALRIQAEVARLQQEQTKGLTDSVAQIKSDLESIQKQTGAAQLESSKHFEKISEQVTSKVVEGWEQINKHLGETHKTQVADVQKLLVAVGEERKAFTAEVKTVQESQVKSFNESIASMERTAARVSEQMTQMQQQFVRTFGETATKQATEIKAIQGEVHERVRTDADQMRQMVTSFVETLNTMREQTKASQQEVAEQIRGSGPALREQMREMMREIGEGFRQQLTSLEQSRQQSENVAREFMSSLNQMRQAQTQATTETVTALRDAARELQREMANSQQAPLQKIAEVSQAVMEQARKVHGDMEAGTRALSEAARQIAESTKQGGDSAVRTANDQLEKIARVGKEMADTLANSQRKLAEQMEAQARLSDGQAKMVEMQESLAANLKLLATSDDFKKALSGIDSGLDMLNPVLKELSAKAGVVLPKEPGADGRNSGGVSRLWRKVKGG